MWQDIVIAIVSLLFGFVMIPQFIDAWRGSACLNLYTAGLTTVGLFIMSATFVTLNLWISVVAEAFSGVIWLLLFVLSYRNRKREKNMEKWKAGTWAFAISLIVSVVYTIVFFYIFLEPDWNRAVTPAPLVFLFTTSVILFCILFCVLFFVFRYLNKRKNENQ